MKVLCFDIGNTRNKLAVFDNNNLIYFNEFEINDFQTLDYIFSQWGIDAVIIACVTIISEQLTSYLFSRTNQLLILDHETLLPVENYYETKVTLGKDRIAAVIGANFLYPNEDLLVIDAGTAITYDIINCHKQYLGGNISPGIQMRYKALHAFTQKLPLLDNVGDYVPFGKNTHDAIKTGVLQGTIAEVEGTIKLFEQYFPELRVILTGGDAGFFDNKLKSIIFVVPNLVMIGLNWIMTFNFNHGN